MSAGYREIGAAGTPLDTILLPPYQSLTDHMTGVQLWTPIDTLVAVEGHRWAIEGSFETAKNEFGLDHNETRSWHGWHRHVSLVMLAFAMMAVIRYRANDVAPPKRPKVRTIRI